MAGHQEDLISRDVGYSSGMPLAQGGTPAMYGQCLGNEHPGVSKRRTAKSKVHIFQIRLERLVETADPSVIGPTDEQSGEWSKLHPPGRVPERRIHSSRSAPKSRRPST